MRCNHRFFNSVSEHIRKAKKRERLVEIWHDQFTGLEMLFIIHHCDSVSREVTNCMYFGQREESRILNMTAVANQKGLDTSYVLGLSVYDTLTL